MWQVERLALVRIGDEIDDLRRGELQRRVGQVLLHHERELEGAPRDAVQLRSHPEEVPVTPGGRLPPGKPRELVRPVDHDEIDR